MPTISRAPRVALLAICLTSVTAIARADEPPSNPRAVTGSFEATRLHDALTLAARSARDGRTAGVATGLVAGAALVPAGILLARRSDAVSQSIGVGMTAGGTASLLFASLSLPTSSMERIAASFDARLASGASEDEIVHATEADWAAAADSGHDRRVVRGWISVGLGAALTGTGLYMLLADPGVLGQSRDSQYGVGSFLVGPGVPILGVGLRSLLQESTEEASWKAYRATKGAAPSPIIPVPALSFAPVRGGGVAVTSFSF
jgi:hypothetical protein